MRAPIRLIAAALILLGLELSTRTVSLTLSRIASGFSAMAGGLDFHVSSGRFMGGFVLVGVGAVLYGMSVVVIRAERRVSLVGDKCPACHGSTKRVKRKRLHRMLASVMGQRLTRRKCEDCHWVGLSLKY